MKKSDNWLKVRDLWIGIETHAVAKRYSQIFECSASCLKSCLKCLRLVWIRRTQFHRKQYKLSILIVWTMYIAIPRHWKRQMQKSFRIVKKYKYYTQLGKQTNYLWKIYIICAVLFKIYSIIEKFERQNYSLRIVDISMWLWSLRHCRVTWPERCGAASRRHRP